MNVSNLPDILFRTEQDVLSELNIFNYEVRGDSSRNKINMNKHVLSFLIEGQKEVHFSNKSVSINTSQSLLIASGNFLMTEHMCDSYFRCLLFFFSQKNIDDFFLKYPLQFSETKVKPGPEPYFL